MQLSEEQKQQVSQWVAGGASLADIQRQITATFGLALTYMDVRFLVLDLGLTVQDKKDKVVPPPLAPVARDADPGLPESEAEDLSPELPPELPPGTGTAKVDLDRVMKPGSIVSGTVTFGDGVTAAWALDQFGRLAMNPPRPGYAPSPADVQAFQVELRRALERRGF